MIRLIVNNSYSQVVGLPVSDFKNLRSLLSYTEDPNAAYYSGRFRPKVKHLVDAKGFFPTGLLARVVEFLGSAPFSFEDKRVKPKTNPILPKLTVQPYPDQIRAMEAITQAGRGGAQMPTGSGKTLVAALIIAKWGVRTLVVVPSLEIKRQMQDTLDEVIGKPELYVVENIDSPKLKKLKDFDALILDEVHHAAAKTYQLLNRMSWTGIYYRAFLSATYFRNNENEQLSFEGIAGEITFSLSYVDAIAKGYIVPVEAWYQVVPKRSVEGRTWAQVYRELVTENAERNAMIGAMLSRLTEAKASALCLVKEIKHGVFLSMISGVPFANGQDEESRKLVKLFAEGKIKQLIGTTGILAEGVDTKPCEYVIIAGLGKAKSAFLQAVGRGVRKYPGKESCKVLIYKDTSHKWTRSHFNEQQKILFEFFDQKAVELK